MSISKGPWRVLKTRSDKYQVYAAHDDLEIVAEVCRDRLLQFTKQDHEANAYLIASAPEMYRVLKQVFVKSKDREIRDMVSGVLQNIKPSKQ